MRWSHRELAATLGAAGVSVLVTLLGVSCVASHAEKAATPRLHSSEAQQVSEKPTAEGITAQPSEPDSLSGAPGWQRCEAGEYAQCQRVAEEARPLLADPEHRGEGRRTLQSVCHARTRYDRHAPVFTAACVDAGRAWLVNAQRAPEFATAAQLFDTACAWGDYVACQEPALQLRLALVRDAYVRQALSAAEESCRRDNWLSCEAAGETWLHARAQLPISRGRAAELYAVGCNAGGGASCLELAWLASDERRAQGLKPQDVAELMTRATTLLSQGCTAGSGQACAQLGFAQIHQHLGKHDPAVAHAAFERGCELGDSTACRGLAGTVSSYSPTEAAAALARQAELIQTRCHEGDLIACDTWVRDVELQGVLEQSDSPRSDGAAEGLYELCEQGLWRACGRFWRHSKNVTASVSQRVHDVLEATCSHGGIAACTTLGEAYGKGLGPPPNQRLGAKYLLHACVEGRAAQACSLVTSGLATGGYGFPRDLGKAEGYALRACEAGTYCDVLAEFYDGYFGDTRWGGVSLPPDLAGAGQWFEAECGRGGADACAMLGLMHEFARGSFNRDREAGRRLLAWSCEKGSYVGCRGMDRVRTEASCKGVACVRAAEERMGLGDVEAAMAVVDRACGWSEFDPEVCFGVAQSLAKGLPATGSTNWPVDLAKAAELFEAVCVARDTKGLYRQMACERYAWLIRHAKGGLRPNSLQEARHFRKACEAGSGSACFNVAEYYRLGDGVPRSSNNARRYYQKGCQLKDEQSCMQL